MTPELLQTILDLEPYLEEKEGFDSGDLFGMVNWELEQKDRIIKKLKTEIKEYRACRESCALYQLQERLPRLNNLKWNKINL